MLGKSLTFSGSSRISPGKEAAAYTAKIFLGSRLEYS
jgi:hypothetical protein